MDVIRPDGTRQVVPRWFSPSPFGVQRHSPIVMRSISSPPTDTTTTDNHDTEIVVEQQESSRKCGTYFYYAFLPTKLWPVNRFVIARIKLALILVTALLTQAAFSCIYIGWQHWLLLLRGDQVIRDGCIAEDEAKITDCEDARLSSLFLFASTMDNCSALLAGFLLDTLGSFPVLAFSWTCCFSSGILVICGSYFRITSIAYWRVAFAVLGISGSQFNFGFMDVANRFPPHLRMIIMNLVVVFQVLDPLTMLLIHKASENYGHPPLWKPIAVHFGAFGIPLCLAFIFLFDNSPSALSDDVSCVTGSYLNRQRSSLLSSFLTADLGTFRGASSVLINERTVMNKTEITIREKKPTEENAKTLPHEEMSKNETASENQSSRSTSSMSLLVPAVEGSPDPLFDTSTFEEEAITMDSIKHGAMLLDSSVARKVPFKVFGSVPSHSYFSGGYSIPHCRPATPDLPWYRRCLQAVITQLNRFINVELILVTFMWYVPNLLGKEVYFVNLMSKTGVEFATSFSGVFPFVALSAALTGGPLFQLSPPKSILVTMIIITACQTWAQHSTRFPDSALALWSGGVVFAWSVPLVLTARFCYFKWYLSYDYGFLTGLSSTIAGACVPILMLQDVSNDARRYFSIFFASIAPGISFVALAVLLIRAYYRDHQAMKKEVSPRDCTTPSSLRSHHTSDHHLTKESTYDLWTSQERSVTPDKAITPIRRHMYTSMKHKQCEGLTRGQHSPLPLGAV